MFMKQSTAAPMLSPDGLTKEFLAEAACIRPDYASICNTTRIALACYFEGEQLRRIIQQWPKEETEKFEWRRNATLENFDNFVKEVTESYVEGVFRTKQPERTTGDTRFDGYLASDYADLFAEQIAPFSMILPELYIKIAIPPARGAIDSMADAEVNQGLPYPTVVFPQYCSNFGCDENGEIEWIVFFKGQPPTVDTAGNVSNNIGTDSVFEIYTDTEYCMFKSDGSMVGTPIQHGYNALPVVRVTSRKNHAAVDPERCGHAMLHTIVMLTKGCLTATGLLLDFVWHSLYPKLVAGEDTIEGMIESGMGANKPIAVPTADAAFRPDYLRVPVEEFVALERLRYERIPNAVYRSARLRDRVQITNSRALAAQSGESKKWDMVPESGVLRAVSKFLRKIDMQVVQLMAFVGAMNNAKITIEYPTTFDTKSTTEMMNEIVEFGDAMTKSALPSSTLGGTLIAGRAYLSMLPDISEQERDQILTEIDTAAQEADANAEAAANNMLIDNTDPTTPDVSPTGVSSN